MAKRWGRWLNVGGAPIEGGQGRVFTVRDTAEGGEPGRGYALKELKNPKRIDRFRREIETLAALEAHPNVVAVLSSDLAAESPYYVMDLADCSLEDARVLALDVEHRLRMLEQVCSGVAHLHASNIVHRDLKPANVLLFG